MDLLEFGHAGATILAYPTSKGSFFEWEDRGMTSALWNQLSHGHFKLVCIDSVDTESWYANWKHPGARAWRQEQYDAYVANEVLPFCHSRTNNPYTIVTGASFGAYHALDFAFRHPDRVNRVLSMSGLCDIRNFADGYYNDTVYYHNPIDFVRNETDGHRLYHLRKMDIILAVGNGDRLVHQNRELSGVLWSKGIGNALREWDGFAHDWPVWYKMVNLYAGGHD
jgi:esterase/lipase superfamily enzyme